MKIAFYYIDSSASLADKVEENYIERIKKYTHFSVQKIKEPSGSFSIIERKQREGKIVLEKITKEDILVLLDENGKEYSSVEFSKFIEKQQNTSVKSLIFLIGGAYGFSEEVYARANYKISLSKLTFPHKLARILFVEQLYRAFTILRGEQYHHV